MTKDQNHNKPRVRNSRIRAPAPRRSNEYYNALINTTLYNLKLGSKEAHKARHKARLSVVHSETTISQSVRQEAAKDLRLHGQSLTNRKVSNELPKFKYHCVCPTNWLICLYK